MVPNMAKHGTSLTKQPSSFGSTGCLKGWDSGSCLYKFSRVGISASRNSSGRNTAHAQTKGKQTKQEKSNLLEWLTVYCIHKNKHSLILGEKTNQLEQAQM